MLNYTHGSIHFNFVVQISSGTLLDARSWGCKGKRLGRLDEPHGIVVTRTGSVWVADTNNHRLCLLH
jgi:hypothetical protein